MSNVFNARVALTLLIGVLGLTSVVGAQLRAKHYDDIDVSLASTRPAAQFADPAANHALSAVAQRAFGELSANDAWTKNGVALGSNSAGVMQPAREAANASYTGAPVVGTRLIYIHPDAEQQRLRVGSPLMATDGAGAALWREDYSAFGVRRKNETAANSGNAANSLWYIGKPQDNVTGLVYFGARWYDPQVGRFMGFDPVGVDEGNPHSFNRYAYGNNNPYKYLDPDGRVPVLVPLAVFAWRAYSAYDTVTSAAGNISTLASSTASTGNKIAAGAELAGSLVGGKGGRSAAIGVVHAAEKAGDAAKGASEASKKAGHYTIVFDNGKSYHGKGSEDRMKQSIREKENEYGCKASSCDWKQASNDREAFKDEARRIRGDEGGVKNDNNYNKRNSPGEKYLKQDGE